MKTNQYTIRGIPDRMDDLARERASRYHTSLNSLLLDALARGLGVGDEPVVFHDMDDLAGTWVEDPAFDEAMGGFQTVDTDLWK